MSCAVPLRLPINVCALSCAGVGENMQDHPACLVAQMAKDNCGHTSVTDELYHVRSV